VSYTAAPVLQNLLRQVLIFGHSSFAVSKGPLEDMIQIMQPISRDISNKFDDLFTGMFFGFHGLVNMLRLFFRHFNFPPENHLYCLQFSDGRHTEVLAAA
jgi:hypothetical protein